MSATPGSLGGLVSRLAGLTWTHYLEATRQPLYGVVVLAGLVIVAVSPALAVFSVGRAEALVLDLGASALLFFCVFLAAVTVGASAADRLKDGTTTLLLTHPVGAATLLLGQLLGALLALAQAGLLLSVTLLWAVRHGPDELHWGVLWPGLTAVALSLAWGVRASLAKESFQTSALGAATVVFPLLFLLSLRLGVDGTGSGRWATLDPVGPAAAYLAVLAALPFMGVALLLSTRFGAGATATGTLVLFLLSSLPYEHAYLVPDLQLYWIGDAAYTGTPVPVDYLLSMTIYSALYALGALGLGAFALEGRELGRGQ